jgi:hypothetical protein
LRFIWVVYINRCPYIILGVPLFLKAVANHLHIYKFSEKFSRSKKGF